MSKTGILAAAGITALCVAGWAAVGTNIVNSKDLYKEYVKEADAYAEDGLYQRAIASYELALQEKSTEDVYERINISYAFRYAEAPKATIDAYMNFLSEAVGLYPANKALVDSFVEIYSTGEAYDRVYTCLKNAIENGYDTEENKVLLKSVRYKYSINGNEFADVRMSVSNQFLVLSNEGLWSTYNTNGGYGLSEEYAYVGAINSDGWTVAAKEDSRLVDTGGMVYGIFDGEVTDSGLYASEVIPACINGKYSYYDEFANKKFGDYSYAGSFSNGVAAVMTNNSWKVIDKSGKVISDGYDEVVVDYAGRCSIDERIIARKNGKYGIYDTDMKLKQSLDASDVDILTKDGLIAFCKNGKWGFADTDGEVVISPAYEEAKSFSNGLAAVKRDGMWGFIDKSGEVVIECQFTDAQYMNGKGECPVKVAWTDGNWNETENPGWRLLELSLGIKED